MAEVGLQGWKLRLGGAVPWAQVLEEDVPGLRLVDPKVQKAWRVHLGQSMELNSEGSWLARSHLTDSASRSL